METDLYSGISILRSESDPTWARSAAQSINETLVDHAHCEKKAAVAAMSMIASYSDDAELIRTMTALATEELSHFREVFELLVQRSVPLGRDPG
ncbi:MAG: tRNA-(ms[2]io[6]A)-hydroxylase, partial [Planctomycetes bacterium]|nr:tRNA-(ms[2]io[6]A)-hydroxylase [Planctomycetota bacterium]